MLIIKLILGIIGIFFMFIALYGLINKKSIIKATKQAQRDLNNNDSGLLIVHTATRIKPGSRGLKKGKKLSKFYLDTI